jgi:predicted benzoate:H+ symporter BenE
MSVTCAVRCRPPDLAPEEQVATFCHMPCLLLAMAVLVVIAVLLAVAGLMSLTKATLGVGLICLGAVAAILARIVQADRHEGEMRRLLGTRSGV